MRDCERVEEEDEEVENKMNSDFEVRVNKY